MKNFRRCVSCRNTFNQSEMLRIAKIQGSFTLDVYQNLGGRGAYVCKKDDCLKLAIKKRLFNRSFKTNIPQEIYENLEEYAQNNNLSGVCKKIQ